MQLSKTGTFSTSLLATDNGAPLPSGWSWAVSFTGITGVTAFSFSFFLAFANGATQDISSLAQMQQPPAVLAYLPLPTGTPSAGQVPIATGVGEASAWTSTGIAGSLATLGADGHLSASQTPRPTLYGATGLRRFRAAVGDSLFSQVPVVCVGDSITAGQGGDNSTSVFSNIPDNSNGWVGQLRALYATSLGSYPGEGFIFADDSRVTFNASNSNWSCTPLRHGPRLLHGSGNTLTLTIPAGITSLGIIQANQTQAFNSAGSNLADVSALYSQTGSATVSNASITALTNTGRAVETDITCQPGDVFTISAPATAQSYIVGFSLKTANPGVLVHRIGQPGYVSGDLLGGQTSGTLSQTAGNQVNAARAIYDWAGTTGLVIVSFGVNDQVFQQGGGTAQQNNVTLSLYTAWMEQFINQAVSDGWCCLVLGNPRNPVPGAGNTQDDYWGAMKSFALATDSVAFIDVGELWGGYAAAAAVGLTANTSVHPLRRGHGDIARMLITALEGPGITELVAA